MIQTKLYEFFKSDKLTCPICKVTFKSAKGVAIHLAKTHSIMETPDIYPGEEISVAQKGNCVELVIRMKRSLWEDIRRRAKEENKHVDNMVFKGLADLAAFGTKLNGQEQSYIS